MSGEDECLCIVQVVEPRKLSNTEIQERFQGGPQRRNSSKLHEVSVWQGPSVKVELEQLIVLHDAEQLLDGRLRHQIIEDFILFFFLDSRR